MPEVELSSGTIDYEDTGGDGPVVVMVHGLMMDGSLWRHVVASLRGRYRCIAPTLPLGGHRHAMRADADLSMRGIAELLGELLEALELHEVTLVQLERQRLGRPAAAGWQPPRRAHRAAGAVLV
jgi:pimeloyl-ACP methyl ester carboxylesterase